MRTNTNPAYPTCWRCKGAKVVLVLQAGKSKLTKKCVECNGIGFLRK